MRSYEKKFYRNQKVDNLPSAEIIVPIVLQFLKMGGIEPTSVIDLGCGSGNWLSVFKRQGIKVRGVDFGNITEDALMIKPSEYTRHDFANKYCDGNRYSMAMSLECAEHIEYDQANCLAQSLMELSNIVLFSAAIPHQRGKGHINERYQSYWVNFFDQHGYQVFDVIRWKVWDNPKVRGFYAQNMFLFVNRDSEEYSNLKSFCNENTVYDVIHPETWELLNAYKLVKLMDRMHDNKLVAWIYYTFIKKGIHSQKRK